MRCQLAHRVQEAILETGLADLVDAPTLRLMALRRG
jgi:hypothetical protein